MLAPLVLLLAAPEGAPGSAAPVPAPAVPAAESAPAATLAAPVAPPPAPLPHPAAEPAPAAPLVGGFTPVRRGAPELGPVVKAAVAHLTPARHARARLLAAERQVVAGSHYRLLLKLRDGSVWRVMVWQRLDRSLQITEAVRTLS